MAVSLMLRFVKNEFAGLMKRPAFMMFLFLLSLIMMFQLNYNADRLQYPMTSLVSTPLMLSNILTSLFLAYLAAASFAKEFEQRTMNILLTTPLTRTELFLGKMLSLWCLIPIIVVFNALYIFALPSSYGVMPDAVSAMVPFALALTALYFASVIALTILISVIFRRASMVVIVMVVFTLVSAFIGLPAVIIEPFGYSINYGFIFLLPASVMVSGLGVANIYYIADGPLVPLQLAFLIGTLILGVVQFRRSELWG